jgi:hypothetical protein
MNKIVPFMLIFFFISGSFVTVFSSVSASELVDEFWSTKTPMSQARANLGVIAVDGKIYAIGGYTAINHEWWGPYQTDFVGTNEKYDPVTDTWVTLAPMPTPRSNFVIVAYQGKIYCMGGESGEHGIHRTVEVYDIATDSWNVKKDMPFDGFYIQAHVVDGKIFVIKSSNLFMYEPITDIWTQKTSMPQPADIATHSWISVAFSVGTDEEIMLCYFGYIYDNDFDPWASKSKVINYDTKTDVWSEEKTLSKSLYGKGCMTTGVYAPKKIYTFGLGNGQGKPALSNCVHDPVENTWSTIKNMPTYRDQFGVVVVDDILYVIGGKDAWEYDIFSINEQYIPIGYNGTIPPVTSPPIVTESPNATDEPSNPPEFFFNYVYIIVAVITSGVAGSLILYFNKKKRGLRGI